jgi:transaldolase
VIAGLCDMDFAHVFYQLTAPTLAEREAEARKMLAIHTAVGLKIPCTIDNLGLAAKFVAEGVTVGLTTIFSAAQVYLASEAGANYVVPYVNRSTRLLGDGPGLVHVMREVIEMTGAQTEIIAASVKSPDEAVQALQAGAHHLTLPLELIEAMGEHPLSWAAIEEFAGE